MRFKYSTRCRTFKKTGKPTAKPTSINESGRSMVEMLGVLAIIGVLSIAGIVGYKMALTKHSANEIINEVDKRAIIISQQRIVGNEVDISEMPEKIKDKYDVWVRISPNINDQDWFAIDVDNVPTDLCKYLVKTDWAVPVDIELSTGGDYRSFADGATCQENGETSVSFVFWNDLSVEDEGFEPNPEIDPACVGVKCNKNQVCVEGYCRCQNGAVACNGSCCKDNEICLTNSNIGGCVKGEGCRFNSDCADNEYCAVDGHKDGNAKTCYRDYVGTCTAKGELPAGRAVERFGNVYLSPNQMTRYSAQNWCMSHGKKLIDFRGNSIGCFFNRDGVETAWEPGPQDTHCLNKGTFKELKDYCGGTWIWSQTDWTRCKTYVIFFSHMQLGVADYIGDSYPRYHALCVDHN